MIGFMSGTVILQDGWEVILKLPIGIGVKVCFAHTCKIGDALNLYISQVNKEEGAFLYGFTEIYEIKYFELLLKVKGIGPKSAFSLISNLGVEIIHSAILLEDKRVLQKVPGIGIKAASQIILDLKDKISKVKIKTDNNLNFSTDCEKEKMKVDIKTSVLNENITLKKNSKIIEEGLLFCRELGFEDTKVLPVLNQILKDHEIHFPAQLVKLILQQI